MRVTLNGVPLDVDTTTLGGLLGPVPRGHAAAVNGEVVPRSEHLDRRLADGDVVDMVTAVAGG